LLVLSFTFTLSFSDSLFPCLSLLYLSLFLWTFILLSFLSAFFFLF
jgi:hypothetical protein